MSRLDALGAVAAWSFLPFGYVVAGVIGAAGPPDTLLDGAGVCALALAAGLISRDTRMLPRLAT